MIWYPDGNKKEYQYDSEDQLIYLKKESGEEYRLSYDAGGHLTTITDKQGRSSSLLYDDCGKLHQKEKGISAYKKQKEKTQGNRHCIVCFDNNRGCYFTLYYKIYIK